MAPEVAHDVVEETEVNGSNDIIEDVYNSSMEGFVSCLEMFMRPSETKESTQEMFAAIHCNGRHHGL